MIFKNSLLLAIFSAASLFLAIIRDRLLATHVTVGSTLDIYNAAFRVPDLVYGALLAFVTAGTVVPYLTKENNHGAILDPRQKLYSLTLFFGGIISILSVVVGLLLPLYARYIVPGFTEEQVDTFIFATRLLLIQPFFLGISSLISCFADTRNEGVIYNAPHDSNGGLSPPG
jgi:peptidoglycan biosynthesis protein MviN/MurJ (putative lipid II flippase)